ncbi:RHS repeat-associated core domain-containing protein [Pseudomonas sp. 148P]|uniref:RHS repeat-associated core domain-containing protein n=1 Tax=Pseudomonas ulcerans TaxID=3115852 RepID=A0ABU7HZV8_9PSED|nr:MULTISPECIES: RHS repeat-associated core domain-containing protein [unclassified Pseudomonas]MEE1921810.1 RHS repeat-associated core domain-containing protein [Pseudomonas sp. 147P]MEE1937089.1 RHS repeat-associated core domain-containing protein [Pseudomonas sp. 148P]
MATSLADRTARHASGTASVAFNGQLLEPSGCYLPGNGYRAYNPALMRFHSPDHWSPFDRGGLNAYAYCSGDPVNRVDPSGRWEEHVMPMLALVLNVGLFGVAALGIGSSAPAMQRGPALHATYVGAAGAMVGAYGAVEQLLGNPEAKYIMWVGTAISSVAAWWRVGLAWKGTRNERFNQQRLRAQHGMHGPAAETRYVAPTSQPGSPIQSRATSSSPVPSPASSVARSQQMSSRSNTVSPKSALPGHMTKARSDSMASIKSTTSASSQQSVMPELPTIAGNIRQPPRRDSMLYTMAKLS